MKKQNKKKALFFKKNPKTTTTTTTTTKSQKIVHKKIKLKMYIAPLLQRSPISHKGYFGASQIFKDAEVAFDIQLTSNFSLILLRDFQCE